MVVCLPGAVTHPPTLPWYEITLLNSFGLCNKQFTLQHISTALFLHLLYQVTRSLDYVHSRELYQLFPGKMSGIPGKWESGTANPNHMLLELTFIDLKINDVDDSAVHSESNS